MLDAVARGADGIFLDEADPLLRNDQRAYYGSIAQIVHREGRQVIVNTGRAQCGEAVMEIADRVMVEHQWRDLATRSLWTYRYAPERFMGVSSNEHHAMGYTIDCSRGVSDTHEAWQRRIGWHTSTDRFVELPEWYEAYAQAVTHTSSSHT
jgi:hypothetical protein